jgi:hypothetical protein
MKRAATPPSTDTMLRGYGKGKSPEKHAAVPTVVARVRKEPGKSTTTSATLQLPRSATRSLLGLAVAAMDNGPRNRAWGTIPSLLPDSSFPISTPRRRPRTY